MERGRPHVMVLPYPVQGHLTPMMHFSLKLAAHGIIVTFVTTRYRLTHIMRAGEAEYTKLTQTHGIRLAGLDDGLPDGNPRTPGTMDFMHSVDNLGGQLELLLRSISPPLSCLVSDSFLPWTQPLADKWGIPRALFWTQSLAVCSAYMSTSKIIASGYDPFLKRGLRPTSLDLTNRYRIMSCAVKGRGETASVRCIPGLPDMDPYDLPYNADTDFPDEESEFTKWLRHMAEFQFTTVPDAAWFIANSFQGLEGPVAHALSASSLVPASKLLLLGPLNDDSDPDRPLHSPFRASLWKEDQDDCLGWLDTQKDASVLYISFGSIVIRTAEALQQVATALLACRRPFLWVLRDGWEEARASLSREFWEFAMEAGKVMTWVPQLKVLSHRAVGGFFSHAGWNSTVESISKGMPILAWPCFLDQFTNSWAISQYWKVGVQVIRKEGSDFIQQLEKAIHALMHGPQSLAFKERASQLANTTIAPSNSNRQHLNLFIEDIFRRASKSI